MDFFPEGTSRRSHAEVAKIPPRQPPVWRRTSPSSAYYFGLPSLLLVSIQRGIRRKSAQLMPEQIAQNEENVGRPLCQSTHVVRVPGASEGDIEPQTPSIGDQFPLKISADAVQHLEFEGVARDAVGRGEAL